jgi:beta-lactamase class A
MDTHDVPRTPTGRTPPTADAAPTAGALPTRRALLAAGALLPLAACGAPSGTTTAAPSRTATASRGDAAYRARFAALERRYGARLGVFALATGGGATLAYRADERFAFCSTFKALAAAAVLHGNPLSHLAERVPITRADVDSISPVTARRIGTEMTIRELCDAAIRFSDGTAGNLLMRDAGGPRRLTAYLRGLGDTVSRMDDYEPALNKIAPNDPRDTTTPRAIAADYRTLVLGNALPAPKRTPLRNWLLRSTTGTTRIRAGLPKDWRTADKTGNGDWGRVNDVAITWPPHTPPLVIAILTDRPGYHSEYRDPLIANAAHLVATALT